MCQRSALVILAAKRPRTPDMFHADDLFPTPSGAHGLFAARMTAKAPHTAGIIRFHWRSSA
jgi:hypothetical protein